MTVSTSVNKIIYPGTGAQTVFTFSFTFPFGTATQEAANFQVFYTDTLGNITLLTQGPGATQYQITFNPPTGTNPTPAGGSVTYNPSGTPIALGTFLTILRNMPLTQGTSLANQGTQYQPVIEGALDYDVMLSQQVLEIQQRAFQVPVSDPVPGPVPAVAQRKNLVFGFDSSGNPTAVSSAPAGTISSAMAPVVGASTIASARSLLGLGAASLLGVGRGLYTASSNINASAEYANVFQFGAVGNGVADDTVAFQNAAATSLPIFVPAGTYKVTSTINLTANGQRVIGTGPFSSTILVVMGSDVFAFSGGNGGGGVEDLGFNGTSMTGGNCVSVNGYNRINLRNLSFSNPANGIFITHCNGAIVTDVYMDSITGTYGVQWFGSNTARSDVLSLINVVMSGSPAIGIIMDGNVDTLRMHAVACVAMKQGLVVRNTSGGSSPAFIISHDFEVDFPNQQCIVMGGGFSGGYFSNTYLFQSATTENVNIDSTVFDVSFTGGRNGAAWKQGLVANGRYIRCVGVNIFANGQSASNTWPGVEIGAASIGVTIEACHVGQFTGLAVETQNYGVIIDAGATEYRVVGNEMSLNVTGAVNDLANDYSFSPPRSSVALNGGSNLHRFGSQTVIGSSPTVDTLAFWGAAPTTQQTVTGSRGGNAALGSLLSKLAGYGIIVDGSSP